MLRRATRSRTGLRAARARTTPGQAICLRRARCRIRGLLLRDARQVYAVLRVGELELDGPRHDAGSAAPRWRDAEGVRALRYLMSLSARSSRRVFSRHVWTRTRTRAPHGAGDCHDAAPQARRGGWRTHPIRDGCRRGPGCGKTLACRTGLGAVDSRRLTSLASVLFGSPLLVASLYFDSVHHPRRAGVRRANPRRRDLRRRKQRRTLGRPSFERQVKRTARQPQNVAFARSAPLSRQSRRRLVVAGGCSRRSRDHVRRERDPGEQSHQRSSWRARTQLRRLRNVRLDDRPVERLVARSGSRRSVARAPKPLAHPSNLGVALGDATLAASRGMPPPLSANIAG